AERRVKTLLVLSRVAEAEGIEVPEASVEAEIEQGRQRYATDQRLLAYFDSERGRAFVRSTLRRSRVVEALIDGWLRDHPGHPDLPHREDAPAAAFDNDQAEANAPAEAPVAAAGPGPVSASADQALDEPARAG
nr:hypothetical protein [Chloroflexota bacterium]